MWWSLRRLLRGLTFTGADHSAVDPCFFGTGMSFSALGKGATLPRSPSPFLPSPASLYNTGYNAREVAMKLKVTAIGNSAGIILPKELLARLRVDKGDELFAVETPDGIRLTAFDPELAAQMDVAEQVMRDRRDLLRKLSQ
jgi:putative addiction module antidote